MMKKLRKLVFGLCLVGMVIWNVACSDDDLSIYAELYGTATDYETGVPLENVMVTLTPSGRNQNTDVTGSFRFEKLDVQQYIILVQKAGYQPNRKNVTAVSGEEVECNISLKKIDNN